MILNKIFVISLLSLAVYIRARSISQIGDIRIELDDNRWLCDMIECPLDSERCFVSRSNEAVPSVLERKNICYSKGNKISVEKHTTSPTDPNNAIREYINSYRSGAIYTSSDSSTINFDEKAFKEHMAEQVKNLNSHLSDVNANIQKNIQNQMQNLQHTLNNLSNMFNPPYYY